MTIKTGITSKVLTNECHIGNKVSISTRIRWVQLGGKNQSQQTSSDSKWWPGILYNNFLELMEDLDERLADVRAYCLVQNLKQRSRKRQSQEVVYVLGTSAFEYKLVSSNDEMKNFYNHYEEMEDIGSAQYTSTEKREFEKCLVFVGTLLEQQFADTNEDDNNDSGMRVVDANATTCTVSPEAVVGGARVERKQEGPREQQKQPKQSTLAFPNTTKNNKQKKAKKNKKKRKTQLSIQKEFDNEIVQKESPKTNSTATSTVSSSLESRTILNMKDISWKELWLHLRAEKGWSVIRATNQLHNWYYLKPNCGSPGEPQCKLGLHYFLEPSDVMEYCRQYESNKETLVELLKKKSRDNWEAIWKILQTPKFGWTFGCDNDGDPSYIKEGANGTYEYFNTKHDVYKCLRNQFKIKKRSAEELCNDTKQKRVRRSWGKV